MKFIVLALLASVIANATKPTVPDRDPLERKTILSQRYSPSATDAANKANFMSNLKRDCSNFGYSRRDMDLRSEIILKTYPQNFVQKTLVQEALELCPRSVTLIFTHFQIPQDVLKNVTRTYVRKYKGDQYWPYSYINEMRIFFDTLAQNCTTQDIAAFEDLFCRYSQQIGEEVDWKEIYLKNFREKCTKFDRSGLNCIPRPTEN